MNNKDLAHKILELVGGKDNVNSLGHCATRLRFELKDDSIAKENELSSLEGVISTVKSNGQFQVIVGGKVGELYNNIMPVLGTSYNDNEPVENSPTEKEGNIFSRFLGTIAGIFFPVVPALAGAGLVKAVASLLLTLKVIENTSTVFQVLSIVGDSVFFFLPVVLAFSAGQKFKVNPFLAAILGASVLHPNFIAMVNTAKESGQALNFAGLPIALTNYANSVIPIILGVWIMSFIDKGVKKVIPSFLHTTIVPMFTLLLSVLVLIIAVGPLGVMMADGLTWIVTTINNFASWLVPTLVGAFTPLMVMFGMHYGLIPVGINMLATTGYDTVAGPGMMVSNIAQGGASLAVALRAKRNPKLRSLAASVGVSAILGITEPAMYGISLKYKKPLYAAMLGGGAAGFFMGIFNVGRYAQVAPSILALPSYIGENPKVIVYASIACAIAFVVAFIASYLMKTEEEVM